MTVAIDRISLPRGMIARWAAVGNICAVMHIRLWRSIATDQARARDRKPMTERADATSGRIAIVLFANIFDSGATDQLRLEVNLLNSHQGHEK